MEKTACVFRHSVRLFQVTAGTSTGTQIWCYNLEKASASGGVRIRRVVAKRARVHGLVSLVNENWGVALSVAGAPSQGGYAARYRVLSGVPDRCRNWPGAAATPSTTHRMPSWDQWHWRISILNGLTRDLNNREHMQLDPVYWKYINNNHYARLYFFYHLVWKTRIAIRWIVIPTAAALSFGLLGLLTHRYL